VVGPGGAQTLEARVADAADLAVTFTATARDPSAAYDVALQYVKPASDALVRAVASARARIEQMVVGDVPDAPVNVGPMSWCANLSASWTVDDLHVAVVVETIDGPNGILAQAGPCLLREGSHLPVFGLLRLDSADVALLEANGTLASVVLHELLHVVGFGTTWSSFALVTGAGGADPVFTGPQATAAFVGVDGGSSYAGAVVPLENTGGAGTASSHWRESVFGRELMTGYVTGPANPVSHTTIASLADIGYVVDPSTADPFDLRSGLRALEAPASPIGEELVRPAFTVDAAGNLAPLAR
jgi:hypothetical protein